MALPLNAKVWTREMDPTDVVDFIANGNPPAEELKPDESPLLAEGETVASFTVTMSPEGASKGVTISEEVTDTGLGLQPSLLSIVAGAQVAGAKAVKIWLYVDPDFRDDPVFDGTGISVGVTLTIVTSSVPKRTLQRTLVVKVAQQ